MGHLPRSGIEPVCPLLAGGFLSTAPPGNSTGLNRVKLIFYSWLGRVGMEMTQFPEDD